MAIKICNKCGESNSEGAHLCVTCSNSLKDAVVEGVRNAEKEYSPIVNSVPRNCKHCGERLESGSLKCKYCGSIVTKTVKGTRYYVDHHSDYGCATILLFIATFFIPLVGLIVGGIFAFSDEPNKQDVGKALLIFGLIMIVIAIILGAFVIS